MPRRVGKASKLAWPAQKGASWLGRGPNLLGGAPEAVILLTETRLLQAVLLLVQLEDLRSRCQLLRPSCGERGPPVVRELQIQLEVVVLPRKGSKLLVQSSGWIKGKVMH